MDFQSSDVELAMAGAIRDLCAGFDDEYWSRCDREHEFPWEFYNALAEAGWVGLAIPTEFGGGGAGISAAALLMREIAASGAGMNGCSAVHATVFGLEPVVQFGNERLQKTFLPRAATGDLHVAFGVTEPNAGTDTSRITTRAVRDGDGWRIHGQKIWTTKALEAEVVLLLTRTSDATEGDRFGGMTLFLVDLDPATVTIRPIPKIGRNAVASCETFYDGTYVDDWRMVGEQGRGFGHLLHGLNAERVLLSAEAIGIGFAALERAVKYACEREVFDRPIGANQAISHPLADARARLDAAWLMTQRAAWSLENGVQDGASANMAKYLAAEAGYLASDRAIQTLGGLGYSEEFHVGRLWREARLMRLAPISQEMSLNYLAQQVLRLPRSY